MSSTSGNDPVAEQSDEESARIGAYDLDGDGEISPIEDARAQLGMADARLEQVAEKGGIKGKIAGAAHHIVDRIDND